MFCYTNKLVRYVDNQYENANNLYTKIPMDIQVYICKFLHIYTDGHTSVYI